MSEFGPKCDACVDFYRGECHCQKSVYCGMGLPDVPWDGCTCFLSRRKWGMTKKKRKPKYPSVEEFELGI